MLLLQSFVNAAEIPHQCYIYLIFIYFIYSLFKVDLYITLQEKPIDVNYQNQIYAPSFERARTLNARKIFLRQLWTTSETPVARPTHALCPEGKQTHEVYIHIDKHRYVNKKCNSK